MDRNWTRDKAIKGDQRIHGDPKSRIYLHFLDVYHYGRAIRGDRVSNEELALEARRAFRLAVLVADRVYLPASSYFEGELAQLVLGDHVELSQLGVVYIAAAQESVEEHREVKLPQYPNGLPGGRIDAYTIMPPVDPPPYIQKPGSSREIITDRWMKVTEVDTFRQILDRDGVTLPTPSFERAWAQVPDMLEAKAFVAAHVRELLAKRRVELPELAVSRVIEPAYIDGYADSLGARVVGDLVYLASPFELAAEQGLSYRKTAQAFAALDLLPLLDGANVHELLRFKRSPEWRMLWPVIQSGGRTFGQREHSLAEQAKITAAGRHAFPSMGRLDCQIGVITALTEEFVAMKGMLRGQTGSQKPPGDPNEYFVGEIAAQRNGEGIGTHRIALTQLKRMGTESAAAAAANLFRSFPSIRLVLMVGIACGVPRPDDASKHVRLGDIIVSDRQGIVDITSGAVLEAGFQHRELLPPPAAALLGAVQVLDAEQMERNERPWEERIDALAEGNQGFRRLAPQADVLRDEEGNRIRHPRDGERRNGRPRVFRGPIGSSNLLSRNREFRDGVARKHGLYAIEMEGSGIASAAWDRSEHYGVIRAACDYGDGTKTDQWHGYAAAAAAAYASCVIERISPEDLLAATNTL